MEKVEYFFLHFFCGYIAAPRLNWRRMPIEILKLTVVAFTIHHIFRFPRQLRLRKILQYVSPLVNINHVFFYLQCEKCLGGAGQKSCLTQSWVSAEVPCGMRPPFVRHVIWGSVGGRTADRSENDDDNHNSKGISVDCSEYRSSHRCVLLAKQDGESFSSKIRDLWQQAEKYNITFHRPTLIWYKLKIIIYIVFHRQMILK